jgi:ABC-type dipeptide/oligopeptide/nickel transport system permease component
LKKQIIEHSLSIIFIAIIFTILFFLYSPGNNKTQNSELNTLSEEFKIDIIDIENALDKSLLKETLSIFYDHNIADSLMQLYELESEKRLSFSKSLPKPDITTDKLYQILLMFLKFVFVYLFVLGLTYYGVQTLAVFRFVSGKQNNPPLFVRAYDNLKKLKKSISFLTGLKIILESIFHFTKAIFKIIIYLILFSPAYVIAYSFKTKFDTDSIVFMIFLGVISNALLITYSQKFYTFLISESNKGYVETAMVKNLNNDYSYKSIQPSLILKIKKYFPGHVFNHIFINAQNQYFSTIKEQAAYLITGLIIIEMALNIQGHLGYELMQNLLYQKYQIVLISVFLIYLAVKATEIFVDIFIFRESNKYQN